MANLYSFCDAQEKHLGNQAIVQTTQKRSLIIIYLFLQKTAIWKADKILAIAASEEVDLVETWEFSESLVEGNYFLREHKVTYNLT